MRTFCLVQAWLNAIIALMFIVVLALGKETLSKRVSKLVSIVIAIGFSLWAFIAVYGGH